MQIRAQLAAWCVAGLIFVLWPTREMANAYMQHVPAWAFRETMLEFLGAVIMGPILIAVAFTALAVLIVGYEICKSHVGWCLICLFAPLFWFAGWIVQFVTGQFCQTWRGVSAEYSALAEKLRVKYHARKVTGVNCVP